MAKRRLLPLILLAFGVTAGAATMMVLTQPAGALPPAGVDTFGVNAQVSITSRLGSETVPFTGSVTIERAPPHEEGGIEVQDFEIIDIDLSGLSATGFVTIAERFDQPSTGELRSLQAGDDFPASAFFDLLVDVTVPAEGTIGAPDPFVLYNEEVLRLVPLDGEEETSLDGWPPDGVRFGVSPDPCVRLLRYQLDPRDDDPWLPAQICVTDISVVLGPPPTPTPTFTPCPGPCPATPTPQFTATRTPRPTNTPTPTSTPFGPEDPTFSVGPGGPSGFHPAALLRLGSGGPVTVTGNDNFADAFQFVPGPFRAIQSTNNFGVEPNEPLTTPPVPPEPPSSCFTVDPPVKGATAWYKFTPTTTGVLSVDTVGSNFDTVIAIYTGTALTNLVEIDCNDDRPDPSPQILSSRIDTLFNAGTTYHIQAGGYDSDDGTLHLYVGPPGGAGAGGTSEVSVAITCSGMGLIGCGTGTSQDDIDALSFGDDRIPDDEPIAFSVAPGSLGMAGTDLASQAACTPPEPQADEFGSSRDGDNELILEGDGQGSGCPGGFGLGLTERPTSDNLDALDGHPSGYIDDDRDGQLDRAVYFSLAPGSPSLGPGGRSPADILWTVGIGTPGLYASHTQLGLQASDNIDGLCLVDQAGQQGRYDAGEDAVLFSLKAGSPTLAAIDASPGDVLQPGPSFYYHASELGMRGSDDLDAMKCFQTSGPQAVKIDVGETQQPPVGFWFCDPMYSNNTPCVTKINEGDTIRWNWVGTAPHTVTHCGTNCDNPTSSPLFDSGILTQGGEFEFTFNNEGVYAYICEVHPSQLGTIIVNGEGGGPTPTPTPQQGVPGDANKDGVINAVDSALILQHTAGLLPSINQRADSDDNGQINSIDASLILQRVAGLLDHWPP